ncbi:MAG: hypothetical protein JWQ98_2409 [Chlorobi bacterium]|nr:hypothetical protein [Chlorobiota bacterium]
MPLLTAVVIALAIFLTAPQRGAAQCCPTFELWIGNSVPSACLPVTVSTNWSNGAIVTGPTNYGGPTPASYFITAPNPPGCWPPILTSVTINGTVFPFNAPPVLCVSAVILPCGYLMNICYKTDPTTGCPFIGLN